MTAIKFRIWIDAIEPGQMVYPKQITFYEDGTFETPEWRGGVLMRYTEFQDKNGKEIFEGDLMEISFSMGHERDSFFDYNGVYKVGYSNGQWTLQREPKEKDNYDVLELDIEVWKSKGKNMETFEVVGNIFETPNLI